MTNMNGSEKPTEQPAVERDIPCGKCGHRNPRRVNVCAACGSHLHVVCQRCGHRNERVRSRCAECGQRLHRSRLTRASRSIFGKNRELSLFQLVLLLIGVLIGFAAIYYLSNYKPPEPEGRYAPFFTTKLARHA